MNLKWILSALSAVLLTALLLSCAACDGGERGVFRRKKGRRGVVKRSRKGIMGRKRLEAAKSAATRAVERR